MDRQVLTVQQVAEILDSNTDYVYKLIKEPGFPAFPIKSHYVIPKDAFFEWFKDPKQIIMFKAMQMSKGKEHG